MKSSIISSLSLLLASSLAFDCYPDPSKPPTKWCADGVFKCDWDQNQRFCEDVNYAYCGGTGTANDMAWLDKLAGGDRCCLGHGTIEKGSTCDGGMSPSAAGKKAVKHPHA
ncbi:uncharacterized protein RHO25_004250 [Cercospora beticola]|uniref:Extracellular membrane protein CFEM domain-containing protein n=1 Tax=Cercospora beticola TaxID=122368 RepID=A0ABZ0NJC2_CERBT|nr:hypothetical protein RHO25_004250 [Cercospora beticola]